MANPLKMLKLKPTGIQFIQEVPIDAPPKKVWSSMLDVNTWFIYDANDPNPAKHSLNLKAGGQWTGVRKDGSAMLMGTVTYFEPGKLLRISGQLGMTHLPMQAVVIFELQPKGDGKKTLLRVGTRMYGFMLGDVKKNIQGGWKHFLGQLKTLAEK